MSARGHVVAVAVYLGLALWVMRAVLVDPAGSYPVPAVEIQPHGGDHDQAHATWTTAHGARTLPTAPWRFAHFDDCHPFPSAVTLGHPLYGNAIVGIAPYWLTRDPILTFNVVTLLMLLVSGAGAYALAFHWTRSVSAALVAGAAFALIPARLQYLRWPGIVGNQWTPLALLFAHRLVRGGRWRDAVALAACIAMQVFEGVYQMVPLAVYGLVYAPVLVLRHRAQWRTLWPKLVAVGVAAGATVAWVVFPYVEARRVWGTMAGHMSMVPFLHKLGPGQPWYLGTVLLALAAVGLVDRIRRRDPDDPRLPLLAGCLLLISLCTAGAIVPGVGIIPSLGALLASAVPGLDLVRGIQFALLGMWIAPAVLAAYGVRALSERLPRLAGIALGVAAAALVATESLWPPFSMASFGGTYASVAAPFTIPREFVALLRDALPPGAVLDVPAADAPLAFPRRGHYLLLAAFHDQPTNACCASFTSPLAPDVDRLIHRLPDPRAVDALFALGFRSVVLHREEYDSPAAGLAAAERLRAAPGGGSRLVELGTVGDHTLFRLESRADVTAGFERLVASASRGLAERPQTVHPGRAKIALWYANGGPGTYLHPAPFTPTTLRIRWFDAAQTPVTEEVVRTVVPPAIGANDVVRSDLEVGAPDAPGSYRVTAAAVDAPDAVLATATVVVLAR